MDLACLKGDKYPACIHVSDGHMETEKDEHLRIGDGNFDFRDMKHYGLFSKGDPTPLVLEITRRGKNFDDDVKSRKRLMEMLSEW
jgi:endonuclease IV